MIKVIVCICITVGCAYVGNSFNKRYKERYNLFFCLVSFCNAYEANLDFFKKKLETFIIEFIDSNRNEDFLALVKVNLGIGDYEIKKGLLKEKLNKALPLLTDEQHTRIVDFFKILGKGDASGQKTQLKTYEYYFTEQLKKTSDDFDVKGKTCSKLGVLGGIFLSILVI